MTKSELKTLQDTLLQEYKTHKQQGGFDVHAASITRLYELLYLVVQHLNPKPTRKK